MIARTKKGSSGYNARAPSLTFEAHINRRTQESTVYDSAWSERKYENTFNK